jgi:hypothetical protein
MNKKSAFTVGRKLLRKMGLFWERSGINVMFAEDNLSAG